jgi:hypothetical protein
MDPIRPAYPLRDASCDDISGAPPPPPTLDEREVRELAYANHEALASGEVAKPYDCADLTDGLRHDFDRCSTDRVPDSVLFGMREVSPNDVQQRAIGDCALMATLVGLANTSEGRALLKSAIVENKDGNGVVTSYTVTLHEAKSHWFRATTFSDVRITVTPLMPRGHAEPVQEGKYNKVWPLVIEKAYAQYVGGYNTLTRGSHTDLPMQILTGKPAECIGFAAYSGARLSSDLARGRLVVLETKQLITGRNDYAIHSKHAYDVTCTEVIDGRLYVTLHNPWDGEQPPPIPYDELNRWFAAVGIGSVR